MYDRMEKNNYVATSIARYYSSLNSFRLGVIRKFYPFKLPYLVHDEKPTKERRMRWSTPGDALVPPILALRK